VKRPQRSQLSILAGALGFFAGGLINAGKELVDVMLGAAIGWGIVFFAAYIFLEKFYGDAGEISTSEKDTQLLKVRRGMEKNKGKKIDIMAKSDDDFDDIYKIK
jgi:hypothetical protein